MSRELCFIIDKKEIYLEHVLVDYMDIPIFFLCKDEKNYYISLCTDIENYNYIIAKLSQQDVYRLLHGNVSMRNVILKQKRFWEIFSGEDIGSDTVNQLNIDCIDQSVLPKEGACFESLTPQMDLFIQKFDAEFFNKDSFEISKVLKNDEMSELFISDLATKNVKTDFSKELLSVPNRQINLENQSDIEELLYEESMNRFIINEDEAYNEVKIDCFIQPERALNNTLNILTIAA